MDSHQNGGHTPNFREHSLDRLIVHLSRLYVSRNRVGEVAEFADVCGGVDVDTFGEVIVGRISRGEIRRETTVHHRVDKLRALREEQFANVVEGETGLLHGVSDGHSLEIATVVNTAGLAVNERVIGSCNKRGLSTEVVVRKEVYTHCNYIRGSPSPRQIGDPRPEAQGIAQRCAEGIGLA